MDEGLLGNVAGKRVLDAGCGGGAYSRQLASLGATLTGIDGSAEMISIAERYSEQPNLGYRVADPAEKPPFPDDSNDVVLANMALIDIPRIDVGIAAFCGRWHTAVFHHSPVFRLLRLGHG
jgi:2-polyprenyl-3-methyl-5-hydroxy-6-metoxy-1,4-benzoquinol methylase